VKEAGFLLGDGATTPDQGGGPRETALVRVLAVAHALAAPTNAGETARWWSVLEPHERERARRHALPLPDLARVFARPPVRALVDAARAQVGLAPLDHDAIDAAFQLALRRADSSTGPLRELVCGDFGRAVADKYGPAVGGEPIPVDKSAPTEGTLYALRALTAFDTSPDGDDHDACVEWLSGYLDKLGFIIETAASQAGRRMLVARRAARGMAGHVVLYGHYDVAPFGPDAQWQHLPRELTSAEGRLFARGVADNKGALACRLGALAALERAPALTWVIQGEEETGSAVARAAFPHMFRALQPTVWIDETGYHDHEDGTLRLLARVVGADGASLPADNALADLLRGLRGLSSRWGVAARHECRGLNKGLVEGGCPFNHALPEGSRYLALGVNDSRAQVHAANESIPGWTFPLHAAELDAVFHWVNRIAGAS
jgi:hypothetical protein